MSLSEEEITMLIAGLRLLTERDKGLLPLVDDTRRKRLLKDWECSDFLS